MSSKTSLCLSLAVLGFATALPTAPQQPPEPKTTVIEGPSGQPFARITETIIGYLDPAMNEESFVASDDGRRVAYMVMAGDGIAVVVDGERGDVFEGIADQSLVFSPDGAHFGYVGTRPGFQIVVLDGVLHEYQGVSTQGIVFSSDGSHVGWVASRDGHQIAVVDGVESPPFEGVSSEGIVFSPDGKRYAYAASTGGQSLVYLDGEEGELFDTVVGLAFGPGGKHATYVGLRGDKSHAVIDQRVYGPFDEMRSGSGPEPAKEGPQEAFEISADGSGVGFIASRGEEWFAFANGKEYGPYQHCAALSLSPEGSRVTFLASRGDGWFLVIDGEEHGGYSYQSLSFSPDGSRTASVVRRGSRYLALIDGVEGKEYDRIEEPGVRFSADGKRTAYLAHDGQDRLVVVDGVEGSRFDRLGKIPLGFVPNGSRPMYTIRSGERESLVIEDQVGPACREIRNLVFTADGSRFAYAGELEKDRWTVVIDGELHGPGGKQDPAAVTTYRSVGKRTPVFSPDGSKAAWVAVQSDGWVAVVDDQASRPYNIVMRSTLDFSPDGRHVAFVASREGRKLIVVDGVELDQNWSGFLQRSDIVWENDHSFFIRGTRTPQCLLIRVEIL